MYPHIHVTQLPLFKIQPKLSETYFMTIWFFEIHLSEKAVAVVVLPYTFKKPGTKHLTENSS